MSRNIITEPLFISVFRCDKCGREMKYCHNGCHTQEEAKNDLPSSLEHDGWYIDPQNTLCVFCNPKYAGYLKGFEGFETRELVAELKAKGFDVVGEEELEKL